MPSLCPGDPSQGSEYGPVVPVGLKPICLTPCCVRSEEL